MPKPVCVPCQRFFRVKKNGYYFIEGMPKMNDALLGTQAPDQWQPYKVWVADRWECEGCGANILSGFSSKPLAVQHEVTFAETVARTGANQLQVNDC